jgi:hypothetical protein
MNVKNATRTALDFLSSYGLACIVMILMLALTVIGTIDQKRLGLYEVTQQYFTSLFFLYEFPGGIRFPLPGAYLLMAIFTVNLLLGGLLRTRWRWNNAGLLISHGGIAFLMLSAMITHHASVEGYMTLWPEETSNRFYSYHDWDLAITDPRPADADVVYRIPAEQVDSVRPGHPRTFSDPNIPFDVTVERYYVNAEPRPKGPMFEAPTPVVEGFFLQPLTRDPENESNRPGAYIALRHKDDGHAHAAILWGGSPAPLVEQIDGQPWRVALERRSWAVPFSLTLKEFTRKLHPGTSMAAAFSSDVIKSENGLQEPLTISMNHPLRRLGYTFFQSSFREDPRTREMASTFSVVRNPADHYPLYALIVIGVGLLIHFTSRLMRHLQATRQGTA